MLQKVKTSPEDGGNSNSGWQKPRPSFGELRIIDFGLSTRFRGPEGTPVELKEAVGTPQYLAPEILSGSYDEKCDIWSLGVIAYQMFSQGRYPFSGFSEMEVFKKAKRGKFYLPSKQSGSHKDPTCQRFDWNSMMSEEAKDFIRQLLNTNPKKRPSAM
jgi:calcium-dependent protein kinase